VEYRRVYSPPGARRPQSGLPVSLAVVRRAPMGRQDGGNTPNGTPTQPRLLGCNHQHLSDGVSLLCFDLRVPNAVPSRQWKEPTPSRLDVASHAGRNGDRGRRGWGYQRQEERYRRDPGGFERLHDPRRGAGDFGR